MTALPPPKPPERTSGWAVASLIVALVGGFTVVGGIAAAVCGALGLRAIARSPEPLGGRRLALAGIVVGALFTLVTGAMLYTSYTFGLDGLVRVIDWAGKVDYPAELVVRVQRTGLDIGDDYVIKRPSAAWGKILSLGSFAGGNVTDSGDDLVLVNVWEDAYIACLTKVDPRITTLDACRSESVARLEQSQLVNYILGKPAPEEHEQENEPQELKRNEEAGTLDLLFEKKFGGVERVFLIRVVKEGPKIRVLAGGARKNRFARLEKQFREALESYKPDR